MSDSSSCVVDVKVNDSINHNSKLDDDHDDKKDICHDCDDLDGRDLDHVMVVPAEKLKHQEEENDIIMKKKYGGLLRKKPSLISKDHERAFFDSADWALRKHGAADRTKGGPLEELLPKLEPTPHHQLQSKRLAYASSSTDDELNHDSEAAKLDGDEDEFVPDKN